MTETLPPAGIWQSRGYGWLLEISARDYTRWQLAADGAYVGERGSRDELALGFDRVEVARDGTLGLYHAGEITRYVFDPLDSLPQSCGAPYSTPEPRRNFEVFTRIFAEHYPFFALRGVDWPRLCASHRQRVNEETPPRRLFDILCETIAPLADNHVDIDARAGLAGTELDLSFKADKIAALRARIDVELGVAGDFWGAMKALREVVAQDLLGGRGRSACNGLLHWGRVGDATGYLAILRMFGFADDERARQATDLPRERIEGVRFLRADLDALAGALDVALAELADCAAMIIDVRMNGGGFDRAALDIANRFADREHLAFTKRAVTGRALTAAQPILLEPELRRPSFRRPVYLLTSPRTASAAEIFVLAMMALPNVKRIGEPTLGILSDNLYKQLPMGWEVGLSNEIYTAADGALYEGSGIPPQIECPVWIADDLRRGYRLAVDRAQELGGS